VRDRPDLISPTWQPSQDQYPDVPPGSGEPVGGCTFLCPDGNYPRIKNADGSCACGPEQGAAPSSGGSVLPWVILGGGALVLVLALSKKKG
jgi:hypothetical protein